MKGIYYVKKSNKVTIYNVPWTFVRELQDTLDSVEDFDKLLNGQFMVVVRVPIYNNQKEMKFIKELIEKYENLETQESK
jgi:hypothetical protein